MNTAEKIKPVNSYIGQRIKERRKLLKINQSLLAELLGISYQQIQKYENGSNQISVSRLLEFSRILNVSPEFFYDGVKLTDTIGKQIESDIIKSARTEPLRLLLIEDHPGDVILFKTALSDIGGEVDFHVIHDSEQVMDYLQNYDTKYGKHLPDLIVLDLSMPQLSGLQLLRLIKNNSQTGSIPVLILTNSISKKDMQEAYNLGAAGFVRKCIEIDGYKDSIDTLIRYWSKVVALPRM